MGTPNRRRGRVIKRRRQIFTRLLAAAGTTLVLGLIPHLHSFLILHLLVDAGVAYYVVRLRRWRREEASARRSIAIPEAEPAETRALQPIDMLDYEPEEEHIRILLPEAGTGELEFAVRRSG